MRNKISNIKNQISKMLLLILILILLPYQAGVNQGQTRASLLVKIKSSEYLENLETTGQKIELVFGRIYRIQVADKQSALRKLKNASWVEFAEEDSELKISKVASDPLFVLDQQELTKQWYLSKIKAHEAWEKTQGSALIIAVVDTGIDGKHEDLNDGRVIRGYLSYCQVKNESAQNDCLVRSSGEIAANANSDDNGHGTIVAGILGAIANNDKGIVGINWNIRLMPIKALDATGTGLSSDVALGIKWAVDNGAKIINLSIGGPGLTGLAILQEAIAYAFNSGVLVVAAAGNDASVTGGDLNINPVLPVCADGSENMVVGVAAVDINDKKARFSNYGSNCIDLSAPGTGTFVDKTQKQGLVSTYFDPKEPGAHNLYVYAVGTSLATPMVSGVAALIMSVYPELDVRAVRDRLLTSVDNIDYLNSAECEGKNCATSLGKGRVNAFKAVLAGAVFAEGNLVRSPNGETFLVERGVKRPVSSYVLNQRFSGTGLTSGTPDQMAGFPLGKPVPPIDGSVIKEPLNPTVYLAEGGQVRALSYLAFISRGLKFEQVAVLEAQEIGGYDRGTDAPVVDGVLVKTADHPAVFVLSGGRRQLLSYYVWQQRFRIQLIGILTDAEVSPYSSREYLYPPIEGTLLRGDLDPTVFVIEGGKRRGLSLAVFQGRGYSFANVLMLSQSEADGYERGEDFLQ